MYPNIPCNQVNRARLHTKKIRTSLCPARSPKTRGEWLWCVYDLRNFCQLYYCNHRRNKKTAILWEKKYNHLENKSHPHGFGRKGRKKKGFNNQNTKWSVCLKWKNFAISQEKNNSFFKRQSARFKVGNEKKYIHADLTQKFQRHTIKTLFPHT